MRESALGLDEYPRAEQHSTPTRPRSAREVRDHFVLCDLQRQHARRTRDVTLDATQASSEVVGRPRRQRGSTFLSIGGLGAGSRSKSSGCSERPEADG